MSKTLYLINSAICFSDKENAVPNVARKTAPKPKATPKPKAIPKPRKKNAKGQAILIVTAHRGTKRLEQCVAEASPERHEPPTPGSPCSSPSPSPSPSPFPSPPSTPPPLPPRAPSLAPFVLSSSFLQRMDEGVCVGGCTHTTTCNCLSYYKGKVSGSGLYYSHSSTGSQQTSLKEIMRRLERMEERQLEILQKLDQCCGQHHDVTNHDVTDHDVTNTSWCTPCPPAPETPTPTMDDQPQLECETAPDKTPVLQESGPEPLSLRHTYLNKPLPSSQIPKHSLKSIEDVLKANRDLKCEKKAGTLCQKLVKEAIFGSDIMRRCTLAGSKEFRALPKAELFYLKTIIFKQLPQFWRNPADFEKKIWKSKCWVVIEQACKRLHR